LRKINYCLSCAAIAVALATASLPREDTLAPQGKRFARTWISMISTNQTFASTAGARGPAAGLALVVMNATREVGAPR